MAINVFEDELVLLSQLTRRLPITPSPATRWRWAKKGVRGVKLEVVKVGGRLYTTADAFNRFVRESNASADESPLQEPEGRSEATRQELEDKGLMKREPLYGKGRGFDSATGTAATGMSGRSNTAREMPDPGNKED